jgi:hypothetical protein
MLKEPYISYPHSEQDTAFLGLEIVDANILGRKIGGIESDIFAAGVTILSSYFRETLHSTKYDNFLKDNNKCLCTYKYAFFFIEY